MAGIQEKNVKCDFGFINKEYVERNGRRLGNCSYAIDKTKHLYSSVSVCPQRFTTHVESIALLCRKAENEILTVV